MFKKFFCSHNDRMLSEKCVQAWSDSAKEYVALVKCDKCSRVKYIHSEFQGVKVFVSTLMYSLSFGFVALVVVLSAKHLGLAG